MLVFSVLYVLFDFLSRLLICCMMHQVLQHDVLLLFHYGLALEEAIEELLKLHAALLQEVIRLRPEGLFGGKLGQLVEDVDWEGFLDDRLEVAHRAVPILEMERVPTRGHYLDQVLCVALVGVDELDELDLIVIG